MRKGIILFLLVCFLMFSGCTQNEFAKNYGGTMQAEIPKGAKVLNATWRNADLWIFIEKSNGERVFMEVSRFGLMNGQVKFIEK